MSQKLFNDLFCHEEENEDFEFQFANVQNPSEFVKEINTSSSPENKLAKFRKGTTTMGFRFQGGIIIAVDSRASMGNVNSSEEVYKVIEINDQLLGTMAGGAADCQYWEENLNRILNIYEYNNGERMSVSGASQLFSSMLYQYRGRGLSIGTMIAGCDDSGSHLYSCDNDGNRIEGDVFCIGSGGTFAQGTFDAYFDFNMTLEQAVVLGKRCISEATFMDSGSGGVVRVYHIHEKGWTRMEEGEDNNKLVWENRKERNVNFFKKKIFN